MKAVDDEETVRVDFASATNSLLTACRLQSWETFNLTDSLERIYAGLGPLHKSFPTLSRDDWVNILDEAVFRFCLVAREGRVDAERNPAGYLVRIARNLAIDQLRRRPTFAGLHQSGGEADFAASTIDALADRQTVREGLKAAWSAGDDMVVRVVTAWLAEARLHPGERPSSRRVAERLGVSHTTVNAHIDRFRAYLPPYAADP